jgi:biotin carboxylase
MCVVALRSLTAEAYTVFSENVRRLVQADQQVDLFEYALRRMLKRSLAPVFEDVPSTAIHHKTIHSVRDACVALLSCLAYWGADEASDAENAFRAGADRLGLASALGTLEACGLDAVDDALDSLVGATHAVRKEVLNACVHCVASDNRVTLEEAELIRAVADALECPMPPLLG